ncbi:MAG: response regulator transcription factor [Clostridiales Family XIII bacterium]|jgi:DNA-binding response OmpR family regulator|nr:response regulator transcription factor [Clostridiales Family XIII bacterium]
MSKIMIVDDDPNIRELVRALLSNQGLDVCEAIDGRDALQKMNHFNPDLIIIDVMMPQMDGFELCHNLRHYYENLPILMLTAKNGLTDKVKGFELGADDYLTKPFEGGELIVRVKALLRRYKIEASQVIQIGNVTVDRSSYDICIHDSHEDIPMKEFELLFKLASFPGKTFSRNQLIEDIWGFDFDGNERTLDVHIGRLRERFLPEQAGFKITTVRGLGYRLEVITDAK